MPKGSKASALDAAIQYVKNKLPQTGFFSTLDELIGAAPFEKAPLEQWKSYLKPGRVFEREGVRFPLKQEELDYSWPAPENHAQLTGIPLTKEELRAWIRRTRPDFSLRVGATDPGGLGAMRFKDRFPEEWELSPHPKSAREEVRSSDPRMSTPGYSEYTFNPGSTPYEESATRSTDFVPYAGSHFGPDVISHSRTTIQPTAEPLDRGLVTGTHEGRQKLMRLVEEIQSDRHQKAADKVFLDQRTGEQITATRARELQSMGHGPIIERRGYRTPESERELLQLEENLLSERGPLMSQARTDERLDLEHRRRRLSDMVPDTPFKDPADYGLLELKMQMLNAAKQGQDYLGLIRGEDVSKRFGQQPEEAAGTSHIYDKVYPSVMRKLAAQYGAEVRDVPTSLESSVDVATPTMREHGLETPWEMIHALQNYVDALDPDDLGLHLDRFRDVISELGTVPRSNAASKARSTLENLEKEIQAAIDAGTDPLSRKNADVQSWLRQLQEDMETAHGEYRAMVRKGTSPENKSFPSIVLTPEVRERIKKAGVPIWSLAGLGASTVPTLMNNEETQGFAEGGKVSGLKALLQYLLGKGYSPNVVQKVEQAMQHHVEHVDPSRDVDALAQQWMEGGDDSVMFDLFQNQAITDWFNRGYGEKPAVLRRMADGGSVSGIERLRQLAEGVGTEDTTDRRKRILSGLASQWYGENPDTGEVEFGGGASLLPKIRTLDEYRERQKRAMEGTLEDGRPGIIDEIQSMFLGTDKADRADARLESLKERIRGELGVPEAHGFQENFDESLGTMLGQVPLPVTRGRAAIDAATKLAKLKKMLKVAPNALLEWLTPTVEATPTNYLMGATVGGGLGALGDDLPEKPIHKAEGGEVKVTGEIPGLLNMWKSRLAELSTGLPPTPSMSDNAATGFEELQMKAKGGKIRGIRGIIESLKKPKEVPRLPQGAFDEDLRALMEKIDAEIPDDSTVFDEQGALLERIAREGDPRDFFLNAKESAWDRPSAWRLYQDVNELPAPDLNGYDELSMRELEPEEIEYLERIFGQGRVPEELLNDDWST